MNHNTKKILSTVMLVLVVIILAIFAFKYKSNFSSTATTTPTVEANNPSDNGGIVEINPQFPGQTLPLSNDPKDIAWAVFQKYLNYNKDLNLEGVRSIVYKIASVCNDPKTTIDCKARMNSAYQYGSALKKENFVNVWNDKKQTILVTDFWTEEDDISAGRFRAIIFFVRDESGSLKLLSFSPFKGVTTGKSIASKKEIDDRLIIYTEDNDQDGIADYEEQCLGATEGQTCTKTNPKLRDTNGNGLWDGVEALMNQ
ncbi:MAG: hypothetical protein A3G46_02930 [Candidatus Zambryskibacteria bacterium RIFCSPLOWO2_12_FULL_39_16]|uniref:Uncharacterized protein n=1 Tax=Candidatus Zambryskibacteria bacterium RIFCSPLOWO2_12_FULL_39_16 TaxID=1802775 RepID=A0A1G2UTQ0_9BACT|nr:MAG: hypothetical protein A3I19_02985 [Candidatus Zambryskibacteria bacterium RIFCSPLOWO2_02_FULL_38_13]OHB12770.1 MAG: hypothetical protein A3G46_02930 [Candidatus Zambryskibacteria bacterium RIFCSPLOWO2_12_FULL_39_16]